MNKPKTFKNPRREALAMLREIKSRTQWLMNQWTVASTVYERNPEGGMGVKRPRRPDEYPESQIDPWSDLWDQANVLARQAQELRELAYQQYLKLRDQESP